MRAFVTFRAVLCLSTALMMAISWPLWVNGDSFPRVPWFGWVRLLPAWASWIRFVVALIGIVAASGSPDWRLFGVKSRFDGTKLRDSALFLGLIFSWWMVLEDQFRLQPWMYQFLLMGFVLATCPERYSIMLFRWLVIAIYFHSGLSKLEPTFLGGTGRQFLHFLTRPFGIDSWSWSNALRDRVVLLIPCWETGVATCLALGARRIGVVCAVLQHVGLLVILGPWGLGHSANVLLWNVAMSAEVAWLFWITQVDSETPVPVDTSTWIKQALATAVIVAACVLPFGERIGWWDTWPSFGLYSTSDTIDIIARGPGVAELQGLPGVGLDPPPRGFGAATISLAEWSLSTRRVPIYPSERALNGVAEALALRYRGIATIEVYYVRRPSRVVDGPKLLIGPDDLRKHGNTFWLNSHPAH